MLYFAKHGFVRKKGCKLGGTNCINIKKTPATIATVVSTKILSRFVIANKVKQSGKYGILDCFGLRSYTKR
jgi:hypothetical protein